MKKSVEIQGLPIFSLIDGEEVGRVKQLVIRPEHGHVELFVVENEQDAIGVHVLPYVDTIGVGDFAVTIETRDAIQELASVDGARELLLRGYKVIGTRVLSRKGQLLGHVTEYYVNPDSGSIAACLFAETTDPSSIKGFDATNTMTFGKDVIVVQQEENVFAAANGELPPDAITASSASSTGAASVATAAEALVEANAEVAASSEATTEAATTAETASSTESDTETAFATETALVMETAGTTEPATVTDTASTTEKATEPSKTAEPIPAVGPYAYLVGKQLNGDLTDDQGQVLLAAGTVLTPEDIERVKAASPTLFMKLNRLTVSK